MRGLGLALLLFSLLAAPSARAAQITIASATAGPGSIVTLPVTMDKAEKLAGFKLVMTYDAQSLGFRKLQKSPKTAGLMEVVNDKKPGQLIVVMAGAKGVSGEAMALFDLVFEIKSTAGMTAINPVSVECMSEDLKPIPAQVTAGTVTVMAGTNAAPGPETAVQPAPEAKAGTPAPPNPAPPAKGTAGSPAVKP